MNVKLQQKSVADIRADLTLVFVPQLQTKSVDRACTVLDRPTAKLLVSRSAKLGFSGQRGKTVQLPTDQGEVLLVGLGKDPDAERWRRAAARAHAGVAAIRAASVVVGMPRSKSSSEMVIPVVEGFVLAGYSFDKYRDVKKPYNGPRSMTFASPHWKPSAALRSSVNRTVEILDAVIMARDLVNEIPSAKPPRHLVKTARAIARRSGLTCEVWQGARLEKEKMHGILAVSRGSSEPGALIHMTYKPSGKPRGKVAVVGKGITFDSGGLSLKPGKGMETMKLDMGGAATVLGLMQALTIAKPNVEVHGYVAAAENMPGSSAQKPGDVITYRNGKTAEVLNTDAEGRLVLADALCIANEGKPDCIIDLATLTGACLVALGANVAGVMGNDQKLIDTILDHSRRTGEDMWQLPLMEDYESDIRSPIADIKNIGGGYGGTITAALFLQHFVGDTPWVHLDIAGPAFLEKPMPYRPRGGTGFGIRALLSYIESLS